MKFEHLLKAMNSETWAITDAGLDRITAIIAERLEGGRPDLATIQARIEGVTYGAAQGFEGDSTGVFGQDQNTVAVIGMYGTILNRAGMLEQMSGGATSPQQFAQKLERYANDPNITHIVIDFDTPGGTVSGTLTAANAITYAKKKKGAANVIGVASEMAASAGYWMIAQCGKVVVPENGILGSISVISLHYATARAWENMGVTPTILRTGENKALGQAEESMKDNVLKSRMADMQKFHNNFVQAVATGRGKTTGFVQANWADGRIFIGQEAVSAGLADEIGDLRSVLESLGVDMPGSRLAVMPNTVNVMPIVEPDEDDDLPGDQIVTTNPTNATLEPQPLSSQTTQHHPPEETAAHSQEGKPMPDLNSVLSALPEEQRVLIQAALGEQQARADQSETLRLEAVNAREKAEALQLEAVAAREQAEAQAASFLHAQATAQFEEKARSLNLDETYGAVLQALHAKDPANTDKIMLALEARGRTQEAEAALLAESGSSSAGDAAASAYDRAVSKAKTLMASDSKLNLANAIDTVMRSDSELASAYLAETRAAQPSIS